MADTAEVSPASGRLDTYRAKRDFSRTGEPAGGAGVAPSKRLRFVIQKHAARRLHYDLRLELDGVFRSWAVTRGPSLDPADKRLAVEVEDHPLEYGDFEGIIPAGEYGGGTVQLWDRGYWIPQGHADVRAALDAGHVKFALEGERLHGSWALVRLKPRPKDRHPNWLLIKHRDDAAHPGDDDLLLAEDRSVASGRSMAQIAAGLGAGPRPFMLKGTQRASRSAVWRSNRTDPGTTAAVATRSGSGPGASVARADDGGRASTRSRAGKSRSKGTRMPDFVPPALATLSAKPPTGTDWIHEIKLDGYRLQLRVESGVARIRTRKGLDWTDKFTAIAAAARELEDCVIDGEAVALDAKGRPDFGALQAALSERSDAIFLYAFDLLWLGREDQRDRSLRERKRALQRLLVAGSRALREQVRFLEHVDSPGAEVLESACAMRLEGIISKRADRPYRSGRVGDWIKTKCRAGQEVVIAGWTSMGTELRSLLVGVYHDGALVPAGRVGTGFSAVVASELARRLEPLRSARSPFKARVPLPGERRVNWVRPELVAEIEFAGWTRDGKVRQAAFKGLREDKMPTEVVAEGGAEPETPAKAKPVRPAGKGRRRTADAGTGAQAEAHVGAQSGDSVLGVRISHPQKALWPATAEGPPIPKIELARYYELVAEWILPHLAGRPCSFVRAPDGIEGQRFFQRHDMRGLSRLITLVSVDGDRRPYVQIDSAEALIAAAQTGAVELHPWNCLPGQPDVPGRLVFDLDPAPDVGFERVIAAALEIRDRLAGLGLVSFLKTTGGKGLHVVTPLTQPKTPLEWPLVKAFAREVCRQMALDAPDRYLIVMTKAQRTGRIFLDYLRNDRMSTAVAVLSPRARPGAPTSMPIGWSDARAALDPQRFTLRTVPALLSRSCAWRDYGAVDNPIVTAIERLGGAGRGTRSGPSGPKHTRGLQRTRPRATMPAPTPPGPART